MTLDRVITLAAAPVAWRSLLVLALGVVAVAQLAAPSAPPAASAPPEAPTAVASGPGPIVAAPGAADYPAILEHPLFYPTRQPWVADNPAEPAGVPAALAALKDYALTGIVVSDGARVAVLKPLTKGKTILATEGQVVENWVLREISPERLHFENGSASFDLHFTSPRWPHP